MWAIFSILAALTWAVVNTVDKYILTKWIRTPLVPVIIVGLIGLMTSVVIYFVYGFTFLSGFNIFLALVAGIFSILMTVFYFKALKIGEVSRIVPLFYLSPLFILIFAGIFLGEVFTPLNYLGIFLLVFGGILISSTNPFKVKPSKAFWLTCIFLS